MSQIKFDVTGIGNAIVDVLAHEQDSFIIDHHLNKGSMHLIDEEQALAMYRKMTPIAKKSGGSVANTMAVLSSLGGRASFIGKVAEDDLGHVFKHDMAAVGCSYTVPMLGSDHATGRCLIVVTPDAQRTMQTCPGASQYIYDEDIHPEKISQSKVVFVGGYLWASPCNVSAVHKAAKLAKQAGRQVAFTLADAFFVKTYQAEFQEFIEEYVDILLGNDDEIMALYGGDFFSASQQAMQQTTYGCLTCGAKGAFLYENGQSFRQEAETVQKVVDTTGAGDSCAAGFLYGITNGYTVEQAGRIAQIVAAEIISHVGSRPQNVLSKLIAEKFGKSKALGH